jgi:hypothetical protein
MLERDVETYLRDQCKKRNLICWKMQSLSLRGFPDRMIVTEDGKIVFVEVKGPGGRLSALQKSLADKLRARNIVVQVVSNFEQVDNLLAGL